MVHDYLTTNEWINGVADGYVVNAKRAHRHMSVLTDSIIHVAHRKVTKT